MTPLLKLLYVLKKNNIEKMRRKLTLTIDGDVSGELEELPRKVSVFGIRELHAEGICRDLQERPCSEQERG